MKLPAGYYFDKLNARQWELRGPQGVSVLLMGANAAGHIRDEFDAELFATLHWNGYRAGVIHALREIGHRADPNRGLTALLDEIEHDLLHQVHII